MQGESAGLYYQYYRFAFDTARKAEQTMKQELMRPELDATQFIQFNYWDGGHKGLLSGEALYLDIKRMEMAYHDNNKRELELTRHVSLRQLDPLALLTLQDHRLVHGHHPRMAVRPRLPRPLHAPDQDRRAVHPVGRRALHQRQLHADPAEQHACASRRCWPTATTRATPTQRDDRFVDYFGSTDIDRDQRRHQRQRHVRDQPARRALPALRGRRRDQHLEPVAAGQLRAFDYTTISDVILHIRYTAREAGDPLGAQATKELQAMLDTAGQSSQALLFCLRYDFPTEWSAFVNGARRTSRSRWRSSSSPTRCRAPGS